MSHGLKIFKQGAEAKLYTCIYLGKPTIIKERFQKKYRHPDLDAEITKERIKNEARSIVRCKTSGVKTPTLYLVDFDRRRIYMQYFENSITVKDFIISNLNNSEDSILDFVIDLIARTLQRMHESNIIHGDLTTSNMLLVEKNPCNEMKWKTQNIDLVLIDFGLSFVSSNAEDKGVDLYVLERALLSTHNDCPDLFDRILNIYRKYSKTNVKEIVNKFKEVRARGRKRTMVG